MRYVRERGAGTGCRLRGGLGGLGHVSRDGQYCQLLLSAPNGSPIGLHPPGIAQPLF